MLWRKPLNLGLGVPLDQQVECGQDCSLVVRVSGMMEPRFVLMTWFGLQSRVSTCKLLMGNGPQPVLPCLEIV